MNRKTLKALKGSIAKWEGIVAGVEEDDGIWNCPLCSLFHPGFDIFDTKRRGCRGCPVSEKSGSPLCMDTPYDRWTDLETEKNGCGGYSFKGDRKSLNAAKAELAFLKSLLPEEAR